ncbi:MAG: MFS transporter [Nitrososphaeria archaeon]
MTSRLISWSIISSRVIYSMYWVFLSPAYLLFQASLGFSKYQLGLISWSFIIGAAAFQLPSGAVAHRVGPQRVYIAGLIILSSSSYLSAFSWNFYVLLLSRVLAGAGAAMFFSSAGYVLSILNKHRVGLYMGIYNAAFSIGAALGLFWSVLYGLMYWRNAIVLAGMIGAAFSIMDYFVVRGMSFSEKEKVSWKLDKKVLLLSLMLSGFWGTFYAAETLLPPYFEIVVGSSIGTSGIYTSVLLLFSIPGGIATLIYDRTKRKALFLFLSVIFGGLGFALMLSRQLLIAGMAMVGFFDEMAFSALYAMSLEISSYNKGAMTLAFVNFVNMVLGMWIPLVFSYIMIISPYYLGIVMALITVLPALPLLLMEKMK